MIWQVQEAKNKLSEVIDKANAEGPQTITRRGRQVAVMLSAAQYRKLTKPKVGLVEFLRKSPLRGLKIERIRDTRYRDVEL